MQNTRLMTAHPTRRRFLIGAGALAAPLWLPACARGETADLLLVNGEIHTVDAANRRVEALAVRGNQVLAVGSSAELDALAGPATRVIDLAGRTVLPGINDSHLHLLMCTETPFHLRVSF